MIVRQGGDLAAVADWVAGPRDVPMVVELKVAKGRPAWWLEEAFGATDRGGVST